MAPSNLEIFEVKPSCGSIGQWVYVAGSGFIKPVSLVCHSGSHGVAASAEVYSETDLAFMVPEAAPAQFTITVLSGNRVCHSAQVFSVLESDPPQLERVTPERVAVGDQVWLQGHGFTAHESMAVHLEGRLVKDVQVYSESVAACVIPLDACEKEVQEVVVTVTTHKGVSGPCIIEVVGDAGALKQTTDQSSSSSQDMLVDAMPTQPLKSVALEADPQALQPEADAPEDEEVRFEGVFEAQRYLPFKGWSDQNLFPYTTDPYPWTDERTGQQSLPKHEIMYPPLGCEWAGEWEASASGSNDPEGWWYTTTCLGGYTKWLPGPFLTAAIRRRRWQRRCVRTEAVSEETHNLLREVEDLCAKGRRLVAEVAAAAQREDPKTAARAIDKLQGLASSLSDEKYAAFPQTADFLIVCEEQLQRVQPDGDVAVMQSVADAGVIIGKCAKPMEYARQYCTKREGLMAKKYVEEVMRLSRPLFEEPRFQGLESVEAFKEQYDQLLQHDVDQIIMDRRIERLCKAYDDNMSLVRRSVERKSGEQAHRQWQEVEKILGNLQEDGADHDLTRHDSVQSLLAKHKEEAAKLHPDIQLLQRTCHAHVVIHKCQKTLQYAKQYCDKGDGWLALKYCEQTRAIAGPLFEEDRFQELEDVVRFKRELEDLRERVDRTIVDRRVDTKRKEYENNVRLVTDFIAKEQGHKAQKQWNQLEKALQTVTDAEGADHDLLQQDSMRELLQKHEAARSGRQQQIDFLITAADVEYRVQQLKPKLQCAQAAVKARDGLRAERALADLQGRTGDLFEGERHMEVAAVRAFHVECEEVRHQLKINTRPDGTVASRLKTQHEIFTEEQEQFTAEESQARDAVLSDELLQRRVHRHALLGHLHPQPGYAFRTLDTRALFSDASGQPDPGLARDILVASLACHAVYKPHPSQWLEEQGPGIADWVVELCRLKEDCWLFQGPEDVCVLAFRGTQDKRDVCDDLKIQQTMRFGCKVHAGFMERADAIPLEEVQKLLRRGKPLLVCGHSLGGAVASLTTLRLLDHTGSSPLEADCVQRTRCVTFGMPLLGCDKLTAYVAKNRYRFHHCVYNADIVPRALVVKNKVQAAIGEKLGANIPRITQSAVAAGAAGSYSYVAGVAGVAASYAVPIMAQYFMDRQFRPYRPFGAYLFFTMDDAAAEDEVLRTSNPRTIMTLLDDGGQSVDDHSMECYRGAFERLKRGKPEILFHAAPAAALALPAPAQH